MAFSKIVISFDRMPLIDESIVFTEDRFQINILEVFKASRLASNQVKLPIETAPGVFNGSVAGNFMTSFNYDYNTTSLFSVSTYNSVGSPGRGEITIVANFANAFFTLISNTSGATITITNDVSANFQVTSKTFSTATNFQCQYVKVNVQTSVLAVNILQPIVVMGNTNNPFSFDFLREQTFNLRIQDALGVVINRTITTPDYLNVVNFSLTINNSPFGATVIVTNTHSNGLDLEYSLDSTTWQVSNVFSGLDVDNYTLYVRDQFGCSFNQTFAVVNNAIYTPQFYISKSNSIRYANRITFGDAANYKNDENTLSCEVNDLLPYKEIQQFQSADNIQTQFKSNYATNTATVIKSDGTTVNIPVVKKSSNIGVTDKRDALKYDRGNGKTGIYFVTGNTYDYNTGVVNGNYTLYGSLPYWAVAGNYIQLGSSFLLIEQIVFDDLKNAKVIEISNIYTGVEVPVIAASIFNYFDYEIYEFTIDMLPFLDSDIRVKIEASDPNFTTITYLSELINVQVRQKDTVEIHYWNDDNTDVFYATGIRFLIRQPITDVVGATDDEYENNKTDTNVDLISANNYEADQFIFEPVTKELMRKLNRALSHKHVFIDEVEYVKNADAEVEKQGVSNAYIVKQVMDKTGNVYNAQSFSIQNGIYNGNTTQIPGLVKYNPGFVRY